MITLTNEEYTAVVTLARRGQTTVEEIVRLEAFFLDIEKRNNLKRYLLWIQWQEADTPLQPTTRFPEKWPPEYRRLLERLDRAIASADVDALLSKEARKPVTVLVTQDPAGVVGWTTYSAYFG